MMRIGVLGTCQAQGYAACVKAWLPDAAVSHFFLGNSPPEAVHAFIAGCDLFLAQPIDSPEWGDLRTDRLPPVKLEIVPHILFTGFHPDLTAAAPWGPRHSPLGGYHSAPIAACFCLGIPADRVAALFNRYVYEELGYFDEYDRARDFLIGSCGALGFDIAGRLDEWGHAASFMHTFNHPAIRVLFDITRMSLMRAGVIGAAAQADPPADDLSVVRWPVHPWVAQRLGIAAEPQLIEVGVASDLPAFVARAYACYADADRNVLATQVESVRHAIATLERIGVR